MSAALMRAAHTRLDRPTLLEDPWADRLILAEERAAMLARMGGEDLDGSLRAHPAYGAVILRARYTEDVLAEAVGRGVRQYVIVGAGMDSFALRRPSFARELQIFEIDHPATQLFKTDRLGACNVSLPPEVHLVPADLSRTGLGEALASSPFRSDRPSLFAWLGVTVYLTRAANLTTLGAIAACAPPGSEVVFDYAEQAALEADAGESPLGRVRAQVASVGEPWISGFDPEQLPGELRASGLELIENLGSQELGERYCADRADGLAPTPNGCIARARVAG
jgi:methyltransferase (TIGR00027 family)